MDSLPQIIQTLLLSIQSTMAWLEKRGKRLVKGIRPRTQQEMMALNLKARLRRYQKRKSSTKKKTEAIAKNPRRSYKETAVSKSNSSNAPEPTPVALLPSISNSGMYDMGVSIIWIVYFWYA